MEKLKQQKPDYPLPGAMSLQPRPIELANQKAFPESEILTALSKTRDAETWKCAAYDGAVKEKWGIAEHVRKFGPQEARDYAEKLVAIHKKWVNARNAEIRATGR